MAIPNIVGTATGGRTGDGTFNVTPPPGALGFIAIIQTASASSSAPTITPPSGFTELLAADNPNSPDNWTWAFAFIGNGSVGSTWSISGGEATGGISITVAGYDSQIVVNAMDGDAAATSDPVSLDSPSVTTNQPALIVRVLADQYDAVPSSFYPVGATLGRDYSAITVSGSYGHLTAIAHSEQPTAGATGTATWTLTTGTDWYPTTMTLAIATEISAPIVEYGFNEGSGSTVADSSGDNYDLEVDSDSWGSGHTGGGLTGGAIRTTAGASLPSLTLMTVMFWWNTNSHNVWPFYIGDSYNCVGLVYSSSRFFSVSITSGVINYVAGGSTYGAGWHHIAVVFPDTSSNSLVYVDGELDSSGEVGLPDTITTWSLYINSAFPDNETEYGTTSDVIDDFRVFDSALTPEDVAVYMGMPITSGGPETLVAAYNFDEGSGDTAVDSSGNGHDMYADGAWGPGHTGGGLQPDSDHWGGATFGEGTLTTYTIMLWYRHDGNPTGSQGVFMATASFEFGVTDDETWGWAAITPFAGPAVGWHHLTIVRDGVNWYQYEDGVLQDSGNDASSGLDFDLSWSYNFGNDGSGRLINGAIDDLRIFSTALDVTQIESYMNTPVGEEAGGGGEVNDFRIGDAVPSDLYIGDTIVRRAYLGGELVYGESPDAYIIWQDTFERANTTGIANVGQDEEVWYGFSVVGATLDANITDGLFVPVLVSGLNNYTGFVTAGNGSIPDNCSLRVMVSYERRSSDYFGIVARWDGSNGVKFFFSSPTNPYSGNANGHADSTGNNTVGTLPASWYTLGDIEMRMDLNGTSVRCYVDGVLILDSTTSINTSGGSGHMVGFCGEVDPTGSLPSPGLGWNDISVYSL